MLSVDTHHRFAKYIVGTAAISFVLAMLYGFFAVMGITVGFIIIGVSALTVFTVIGFARKDNRDHPDGGGY